MNKEDFYYFWSVWILVLGIVMVIFVMLPEVDSFQDYFNAFLINRPELSWCPTLLMLYGLSMLFAEKWTKLRYVGYAAGILMLPLGVIVTVSGFLYQGAEIFPHIVHLSELITGFITIYQIKGEL
jgi:hypothetical protein